MVIEILLLLLAAFVTFAIYYWTPLGAQAVSFWPTFLWIIPIYLSAYLFLFLAMLLLCAAYAEIPKANKKETMPPNRVFQWFLGQWCFMLTGLFRMRIRASGLGKISWKTPVMLVSNHLSGFDHVVLLSKFRHHPFVAVSKKENFDIILEGGWTKKAGFLPVDREDMSQGTHIIAQAGEYLKDGKCSVMIAPEGTRNKAYSDSNKLLPFHAGSFQMAFDSHCPIVLVALQNTNAIIHRFPLRPTYIYMDVVGVIEYEQYKDMSLSELSSYCHDLILKRLEEKSARAYHLKQPSSQQEAKAQ